MNNNENYFKDNFTKEDEKVNLEINKLTAECLTSKNNKFSLDSEGNLSVNSITTVEPIITEAVTNLLYPVGSIYMNVAEINPNLSLGGTWERIENVFLAAAGSNYPLGQTGGSRTHTHGTSGHALTINEMPSHNHGASSSSAGNHRHDLWYMRTGSGNGTGIPWSQSSTGVGHDPRGCEYDGSHSHTIYVGSTGGSQAHDHGATTYTNNEPPYLAVCIWKRVA